jgi:hypothetical protein
MIIGGIFVEADEDIVEDDVEDDVEIDIYEEMMKILEKNKLYLNNFKEPERTIKPITVEVEVTVKSSPPIPIPVPYNK